MTNKIAPCCPKCGNDVHCGITAGETTCWCFSHPNILRVDGKACLCPECLAKTIEEQILRKNEIEDINAG